MFFHPFQSGGDGRPKEGKKNRTSEITQFKLQTTIGLTLLYKESDITFSASVFEMFYKSCIEENDFNIYFVSLPVYTWQCGLKSIGINMKEDQKTMGQTIEQQRMMNLKKNSTS